MFFVLVTSIVKMILNVCEWTSPRDRIERAVHTIKQQRLKNAS
jgi:hypothetical protein